MRCDDVDRLSSAYVDGELDDHRSSALRGHLRVCESCNQRVEDEARVREAAGGLAATIDPPPDLWGAIDARLAEAEIADARRPRLALWWQRVSDAARRQMVPLAIGGAAAGVALALWVTRSPDGAPSSPGTAPPVASLASPAGAARPDAPLSGSDAAAGSTATCGGAVSHDAEVACQMEASDRRYLDAIAELDTALRGERATWTAARAARLDASLAELDRAASDELKRLAVRDGVQPADRDPLHAIYQRRIDLLSDAVVFGDPVAATGDPR